MTAKPDHDACIAEAPEAFRPLLERLRATLARTLPDADEVVADAMPGFSIDGTVVAGYTAFTRQCGLYLQAEALTEHAEEITAAGLKASKTGITFTAKTPIPDELVAKLALASRRAAGV